MLLEIECIFTRVDSAFANKQNIFRDLVSESYGMPKIDLKGSKVPIVDTDEWSSGCQDGGKIVRIIKFNQCDHAKLLRKIRKMGKLGGCEDFGNEKDRVRARCARLVNLVGVENEFFPEKRRVDDGSNLLKVTQAALKEGFVG